MELLEIKTIKRKHVEVLETEEGKQAETVFLFNEV